LSLGERRRPPRKSARFGLVPVLLQFEQPRSRLRKVAMTKAPVRPLILESVLAQADIPAVVRPVFSGGPMIPNRLHQLRGAVLPGAALVQ